MFLLAMLVLIVRLCQQFFLLFCFIELEHVSLHAVIYYHCCWTHQVDAADNQFALHVCHLLGERFSLFLCLAQGLLRSFSKEGCQDNPHSTNLVLLQFRRHLLTLLYSHVLL